LKKYIATRDDCEETEWKNRISLPLPYDIADKYFVPYNYGLTTKLRWLEGYCDGDGCITDNNGTQTIQISSVEKSFLRDVKRLINTLGIDAKITPMHSKGKKLLPDGKGGKKMFNCKASYRLLIPASEVQKLLALGFSPKRLVVNKRKCNRSATQFIKITSVKKNVKIADTYCFNEKKRHYGVFNGILTGQCAEIVEFSDENETAVCNLASVCLPRFVIHNEDGTKSYDFEKLMYITRVCTRNLNHVIDRNYYPTPKTKLSNMRHRPIGIGVQGLSDLYNIMGYPFESDEAKLLNKKIFECMYYASLDESKELAKTHGRPYETFKGSPLSKGILQFHMWGLKEEDLQMGFNWKKLINDVKIHGTRNSLLIALMPTASTSQIMGNSECIEPPLNNIHVRSTLAGDFIVTNRNLMRDLMRADLWTDDMRKRLLIYNGSIQEIEEIPQHIKDVYKTAFEIKLSSVMHQSRDRGAFICQSQSLNLFIDKADFTILNTALWRAWEMGLKTGMYYYRSVPAVNPISFGIDVDDVKRLTKNKNILEALLEGLNHRMDSDDEISDDTDDEVDNMPMTTVVSSAMTKLMAIYGKEMGNTREIEECLVCGS
jgi:ribonucleotide reductase alpha subunit